jgi:tripartite ATP-independent transporter DctP family solute receptor
MKVSTLFRSLMVCCAVACSGSVLAQTVLKFGHVNPAKSASGYAFTVFNEELMKRTNGRYKIQWFPNGQLGGEREMIESVQLGTLDLMSTSTGPVANFIPEAGILDIPFLFRDSVHARAVLDSQVGQDLLKKFPAKGLIALAWGDQGFRHLLNNKRPVKSMDDMKGLKVRTMENPVHILAFKTMGVQATPMAWPELMSALQQGTVDGAEMPIPSMTQQKFSDVQKYMTMTGHVFSPQVFLISPKVYNSLPPQDKEAFAAAAKTAGLMQRRYMDEHDQKGIVQLKAEGMQIVEKIDHASIQAALKPAYAEYAKKYGQSNIDRIVNFK